MCVWAQTDSERGANLKTPKIPEGKSANCQLTLQEFCA